MDIGPVAQMTGIVAGDVDDDGFVGPMRADRSTCKHNGLRCPNWKENSWNKKSNHRYVNLFCKQGW